MKEVVFLQRNAPRWKEFERNLNDFSSDPDELAKKVKKYEKIEGIK